MATADSSNHGTSLQTGVDKQNYATKELLHSMQALPELSATLLRDADDGEPYERLVRQIRVLHMNISEFADRAKLLSRPGAKPIVHETLSHQDTNIECMSLSDPAGKGNDQ